LKETLRKNPLKSLIFKDFGWATDRVNKPAPFKS